MIKIKGLSSEDLNGFLDVGCELLGELRFRDTFRIDGFLKGKVVSDNTLVVGESGHVDAEIDCGTVSIRGTVSGRVQAREKIELLAGSKVTATLVAPRLLIEEGAFFQGDCDMATAASAKVDRPAPEPAPAAGRGEKRA